MKFKNLISYILVFLASFLITPLAITSFVKKANDDANQYIERFEPVTSRLPDGIYKGKFKAFKIITMSKVEFEIENGFIKNINFIRMTRFPGNAYKSDIENQIRNTGQLEVNAISGATRTCNFAKAAIKAAIDNNVIK
ncbi:MAG: FMN-binding protein [Bacteroidales bacterium]|nr:FMN-binding protein [Bacteroidales bacterium]